MDQEILDLLARLTELSDDELADLKGRLEDAADALLDADPDDETLASLEEVANGIESVKGEIDGRETAKAERAAAKQALADRIKGLADKADESEGDDGETVDTADTADDKEAVAAAAGTPEPRVSRVAARRPAAAAPQPLVETPEFILTASANVPGIPIGSRLDNNPDLLARAFLATAEAGKGYRGSERLRVPFAQATMAYSPERMLGRDAVLNERRILAVTDPQAIVASGGICANPPVTYDLPTVGTEARPTREALARFGAERGGIRTLPPPLLSEVDGAVSVWTEATDTTPGDSTKPCLVVTCPSEDETLVDAIVKCLEFGNFRARFFPEQIQAWMNLTAVRHAREAEARLLTTIGTGSTQVTAQELLGTTRNILAVLDRAIAGLQGRHRDPNLRLRLLAPWWLLHNIRTDLARQMPVGSVDETLAVADARIQQFFTDRGVNVTWTLDGETGQDFSTPQGAGSLNPWPDSVVVYLFPEGSWLFLDGGTLDLGLVRDSTLNSTNDVQMFAETFEAAHFHGVESLRISVDVCPDGSASALVDIDPCTTGS